MSFAPDRDIPDLSGKVVLVTGGNSGLGKESILQLAKHKPRQIIMGARSRSKADAAIAEIMSEVPKANITFLELDLSSFDSIKKAASTVVQEQDRLDILINNAGLMGVDPSLTKEGYEMQFGSNHVGPALLTKLLLPLLDKTSKSPNSDVRVVQLSSELYKVAPKGGILFDKLKTPLESITGRARYGQSKLANLYYIKSLARKYPSIKCVSLHPGVVQTNVLASMHQNHPYLSWAIGLITRVFFVDVQTGALGQLWAATGKSEEITSGAYYIPLKKEVKNDKVVNDAELAEKLWEWTEKEFANHGVH